MKIDKQKCDEAVAHLNALNSFLNSIPLEEHKELSKRICDGLRTVLKMRMNFIGMSLVSVNVPVEETPNEVA